MIDFSGSRIRKMLESDPIVACVIDSLGRHLDGVHVVGGAARDLLLGVQPSELDLVVEGDAHEIARRIAEAGGGRVQRHDRFGTASVTTPAGPVDLASARRESYPAPGALPEVEAAGLVEDLARRDFTVNAIALPLDEPSRGEIVSVPSATSDLADGTLRVLHPASFLDDPTRLWRLCRYSARLAFSTEEETLTLARSAVGAGALETVSCPRHGAELLRTSAASEPIEGLIRCGELGLLGSVGANSPDPVAVERAEDLLGVDADVQRLRITSCYSASGPTAVEMIRRMALPEPIASAAIEGLQLPTLTTALGQADRPSLIAAAAAGHQPETVALAGEGNRADRVRAWIEDLRHVSAPLDGSDLLAAGVPQGPLVAIGLRAAMDHRLDRGPTSHDRFLEVALRAVDEARGEVS